MINQDEKALPDHILLADDWTKNLVNKISDEVFRIIHSVDCNDINKVFNEINLREDEKKFSFVMTILSSVMCAALSGIKNSDGTKDETRKLIAIILKNFIDGVWKNMNENDSALH